MMKRKVKLTRNGIQYFDAGGTVQPGVTTTPSSLLTMSNLPTSPTFSSIAGVANPLQMAGNVGDEATNLAGSFTAQNGYNAQLAPTTLSDYSDLISAAGGNAANGYNQFNNNLTLQQQLAQTLLAEGNGLGPNPVQNALNQSTGQNINATAALMAGQRGSAANPGLLARQIAQQGAATQQNAVGQAATLRAQQQLGEQQAAAGLTGQIGNEITGEQNANTGLFTGAAGAQNTQNAGQIQNYNNAQTLNQQTAQNNANAVNKTTGGFLNGAGSLLSSLFAKGGMVMPSHLMHMAAVYHPSVTMAFGGSLPMLSGGKVPGKAKVKGNSLKNDTVDAKLSPKEIVLPRSVTMAPDAPEKAKAFVAALLKKHGMAQEPDDFKKALKTAIQSRKSK